MRGDGRRGQRPAAQAEQLIVEGATAGLVPRTEVVGMSWRWWRIGGDAEEWSRKEQ